MNPAGRSARLRVLQSFRPTPATNPYLLQLVRWLEGYVSVETFTWASALRGRYDVLHLHWPEVLMRGSSAPKTIVKTLLFAVVLVVARARRRAIVRTLHNVAPHEPLGAVQRAILTRCDRWTTAWITLTSTVVPPGPATLIPHGHYRDWYPVPAGVRPVAGRVLFFGHIRRYKGISDLLHVAAAINTAPFELRVVGRPQDSEVAAEIETVAARDDRVTARLEFLDDADLAAEIASAQLVILPYRELVNSGAALLALSIGRPLLLPATASAGSLRDEVGAAWVTTYAGDLTARDVVQALEQSRQLGDGDRPDLSQRDWDRSSRAHVETYRAAVAAARR